MRDYLAVSSILTSLIKSSNEPFEVSINEEDIVFSMGIGSNNVFSPFYQEEAFNFAVELAQELSAMAGVKERLDMFSINSTFYNFMPEEIEPTIPEDMPYALEWISSYVNATSAESFEIEITKRQILVTELLSNTLIVECEEENSTEEKSLLSRYNYPIVGFTPFEAFLHITKYLQSVGIATTVVLRK